jgi:pimeloyl-ACP methyl ester carboxylesterase
LPHRPDGATYSGILTFTSTKPVEVGFGHRLHIDNSTLSINSADANILAVVQKPFNQSIIAEASGPPAWKQLPTWYQISENDRLIPPDMQRISAERMNATTLSLNSSHMSPVSHPEKIADLIINATKVSNLTH